MHMLVLQDSVIRGVIHTYLHLNLFDHRTYYFFLLDHTATAFYRLNVESLPTCICNPRKPH